MSIREMGRRQFLMGSGGFALALPTLSSVLSRSALAQEASGVPAPRFVAMATNHGGIWPETMYPSEASLTDSAELYRGHRIYRGDLKRGVSSGRALVSPMVSGPGDKMTEQLVRKTNVIRGLDIPFYISHHTGGYLGNYARTNSRQGDTLTQVPTIDQVMAWSPSFYRDLSTIRRRSIHVGQDGISWGYSNPANQSGNVEEIPSVSHSKELFDSIFVPDDGPETRPPIVDRVLEGFRALRSGAFGAGSRISAEDRRRLDDHMDRLSELQRSLNVHAASCGDVKAPKEEARDIRRTSGYSRNPDLNARYYQLFNDVIVAAFICGTSRIATIWVADHFSTNDEDWHQDIAHRANVDTRAQKILTDAHRDTFEHVFLDLASKLDVEEADGKTYLDNTLMMWSQEAGNTTHKSDSIPIVSMGSAAGRLKTGQFIDYRDRSNLAIADDGDAQRAIKRPGILYNRWLATVLQCMGIPPSEFERSDFAGYGLNYRGQLNSQTDAEATWPDRVFADAHEFLPYLRNT